MERKHRPLAFTLLLAALALGAVLAAPAAAQRGDPNVAHTDGYVSVSPDGRCVGLRTHDGTVLSLVGGWHGLRPNDHVRLEGRFVVDSRCGAQGGGFEVTSVQAIWADDNHRTTYYDHLKNGDFRSWVVRYRPGEWERGRDRDRDRDRDRREPPR